MKWDTENEVKLLVAVIKTCQLTSSPAWAEVLAVVGQDFGSDCTVESLRQRYQKLMRSGSTATKPSDKTPTETKPRDKTPTAAISAHSTLKRLKTDTPKPAAGKSTLKRKTADAPKTTTNPKRAKKAKTEKEVKVDEQDIKDNAKTEKGVKVEKQDVKEETE